MPKLNVVMNKCVRENKIVVIEGMTVYNDVESIVYSSSTVDTTSCSQRCVYKKMILFFREKGGERRVCYE